MPISKPNTGTAIVTSLVEDAEGWELNPVKRFKYLTHRTGLQLDYFGKTALIHGPTWAKDITLSREDRILIRNAIDLIVEERGQKKEKDAGHRLIGWLTAPIPPPKPWWKFWVFWT